MQNVPGHLKYTKEHEWIEIDGKVATVGITEWAQSELGDIVFIEMPKPGDPVTQGEAFGTIEAVKSVSELYSPVGGKVIEINSELDADPTMINRSAFYDGWIIKIEMSDPDEVESLLSSADYRDMIT